MNFVLILAVVCFSSGVLAVSFPKPCKIDDLKCLEASCNAALPTLLSADSEYGIESSDPLFIEEIDGEVPEFKFKMFNVTVIGCKNVVFSKLEIDKTLKKVNYDLIFTKLTLSGKYKMGGKLFNMPIEGSGDFTLTTGKNIINVDADIEKYKGENGIMHGRNKSFRIKIHPVEPINYDFKNLFDGNKELEDAANKFVNEKWLDVAELLQDPVGMAIIKKMMYNIDQHFKHVPFESFIVTK